MHLRTTELATAPPTDADMRLARDAAARLRAAMKGGSSAAGRPLRFKVLHSPRSDAAHGKAAGRGKAASEGETVEIPGPAATLLLHLLGHIAEGEAIAIVPVQRQYTTQQAADFLGVSRPFVVKEIEEKRLPARKVGTRRRVMYVDLMKYKARSDVGRQKALDELAAIDEELGLM